MVSSEFNERKLILSRYFEHPRWKSKGADTEEWDFTYYKGKSNMKELLSAIQIVFCNSINILSKEWFKDADGDVVGAIIYCSLYVSANFNGYNQGTGGGDVYIKFNLCNHGFFYTQSSDLGYLQTLQ